MNVTDEAALIALLFALALLGGNYVMRDLRVRIGRAKWRAMRTRDERKADEDPEEWADRILGRRDR